MGSWLDGVIAGLAAAGIKVGVLVSSAIGGFLSLRFFEGEQLPDGTCKPLPVRQKWAIAGGGTAMGVYLSGLSVEIFELTDKSGRVEVGLGVLIAVFGMSLASAVIEALKGIDFKAIAESWLTRR